MDWMELVQDRNRRRALMTSLMKLRVPENAGNFLTSWKPVGFSRSTLVRGVTDSNIKSKTLLSNNMTAVILHYTGYYMLLIYTLHTKHTSKTGKNFQSKLIKMEIVCFSWNVTDLSHCVKLRFCLSSTFIGCT